MSKALVFSIEEFSTFDGPGLRSTVFLKGCPLACEWCHNPEGQSFSNEIMKAQSGCEGCGACVREGRLTENSIKVCPNRLLRFSAEEYTAEELVKKLEKLIPILNGGDGGITFSGGEPLSHPEFLSECLSLLKDKTHLALQTSGFCSPEVFEKILNGLDYVLYDIKIVDEEAHRKYTGVSNKNILANFRTLTQSGKPFVIRTPLIPTVTDTVSNITAIAELLSENGVSYIELLPYNKMAGSKYAAVGRVFEPSYDENIPCEFHTEIFESFGITSKIL